MKKLTKRSKGIIAGGLVLSIFLYVSLVMTPIAILLDDKIHSPYNFGLRVKNRFRELEINEHQYEISVVREIFNESTGIRRVWILFPIRAREEPSDIQVLEDGKPIAFHLIQRPRPRDMIRYMTTRLSSYVHNGFGGRPTSSRGLKFFVPQVFAALKPISPNEKREVEIKYQIPGELRPGCGGRTSDGNTADHKEPESSASDPRQQME